MEHVLFIQRVKKGKRKQYIKDHEECWPEMLKTIKESGIERNIIWMNGNEVLIYSMSENYDQAIKNLSKKKTFKEWSIRMESLLEVMQDFSEGGNVIKLEKVFDLEEQIERSNKKLK